MYNDYSEENTCPSGCSLITSRNNQYYQSMCVPSEFEQRVLVHVVSQYIKHNDFFMPPMYLAIEGPAGEGKTAQTIAALTQRDIEVLYVSASLLSGNHEKDSIFAMQAVYDFAVERRRRNCIAILIDDFHLSTVNQDPKIEKTINSNLLTGFLMNLADRNDTEKIPVIMTGNDFSMVYAPLLRSGRADKFVWSPDITIKRRIIHEILSPIINVSEKEFDRFIDLYQKGSISDFAQLKNDFRKNSIWNIIGDKKRLNLRSINEVENSISLPNRLNFPKLCTLASERIEREDFRKE